MQCKADREIYSAHCLLNPMCLLARITFNLKG